MKIIESCHKIEINLKVVEDIRVDSKDPYCQNIIPKSSPYGKCFLEILTSSKINVEKQNQEHNH